MTELNISESIMNSCYTIFNITLQVVNRILLRFRIDNMKKKKLQKDYRRAYLEATDGVSPIVDEEMIVAIQL